MRLAFAATLVAAALVVSHPPAAAQQISPMTGTTASPGPAAAPPGAPAPAVTAPAPASPARQPRKTFNQRFEAANTTHDGKLTLEQAKAARLTRVATNFDAIDTGRKGYVTIADVQAYNRARRQAAKPQ